MGSTGSRHNGDKGAKKEEPRRHALLENAEVQLLERVFLELASPVTGTSLCKALKVSESNAQTLGNMFLAGDGGVITEKNFLDTVALMVRGSTTDLRKTILRGAANLPDELPGVFRFVFECSRERMEGDFNPMPLLQGLQSFTKKQAELDGVDNVINLGMFNRWCTAEVPSLQEPVNSLFVSRFMRGGVRSKDNEKVPGSVFPRAKITLKESEVLRPEMIFALSCCDARCQGSWDILFSSSKHGMSFDALAKHLIGYNGPTFLTVKDTDGSCFGALVSEPWREAGQFYGQQDSLLFALDPSFNVRRARGDGSSPGTGNFQYLKVRGRTGLHGVGFGGDENSIRLFLDRNFEECRAADFDLTYESGPLRPEGKPARFQPMVIEAWGLGGEEASQAQAEEHADIERMQMNRRQVDRKKFADNAFDREFLLGKTFAHQEQAEQRTGS